MAKYDHGGGCPCGLYAECIPGCRPAPQRCSQDEDQEAADAHARQQANRSHQEAARLPTDSEARKHVPLATGVLDYFPDALAEVARLSKIGNDKHNPGQPLHWSRGKSDDHADCIMRHMIERGTIDTDGILHDAKVAWRALAQLQLALEKLKGLTADAD
jgi:hypothetical protein